LEKLVYDSWYAHERGKPNAGEWVRSELPLRAKNPSAWYLCEFEPGEAMKFIVGEGWQDWTDWSRPEGTYERVAWNMISRDKGIPGVTIQKISALAIELERNAKPPAFREDPVILRRVSPEGPITVLEGHHRISAVCVAVASSKKIGTCVAYLAEP
jgi:hypothetical protein